MSKTYGYEKYQWTEIANITKVKIAISYIKIWDQI